MMDAYVPLRVRSNYSLLVGASHTNEYLSRARDWMLPALALTEENNLYSAVSFVQTAGQYGIRPILGSILRCRDGEVLLLVENDTGYANLCRILSDRHLDEDFSLLKSIAVHQEGLLLLCRDPGLLQNLVKSINKDRLWVELCRPMPQRREKELWAIAGEFGIPMVATTDVYYAVPEHADRHQMLTAIRQNTLLSSTPVARSHPMKFLTPPEQMQRLFADSPAALAQTCAIAERCSFELLDRSAVFPTISGDSAARLRADAATGAQYRYGRIDATVRRRLDYELDLITRLGYADYFLLVADIVGHARELGTPVAGRGSGASSLVAYCLRITNVDPIRYNLPFERFLNEGRQDYPDLDIDLCWRLRDEVIDYVFRKYGAAHVAMIAMYATMKPRMAFRLTAKALGLTREAITQIQHMLQHYPNADDLLRGDGLDGFPASPATVRRALAYALDLKGFPHHLSVHPGGIVITPGAISAHAPLERAAKGVVIMQYDKDAAEAVGLIKIDLLGNRALSALGECLELVQARYRREYDAESLTEQDDATSRLLVAADTVGINQLESPAMRNLLRQIRPHEAGDLMKALALIRPGAASLGMKEAFVRRCRGDEPTPPIDPRLDSILRDTYGIMLYEDEALQIASALAGLSLSEADRFRKAVSKCRDDAERLQLSNDFLSRCRENGVDRAIAVDLWTQMAKFNAYSFCHAHAASYGRLAWANAYMKTHYPLEFWVGALNNNQGMYDRWVYVEEAKRLGIRVLLPCVNESVDEFSCDGDGLRVGLSQVRELSTPSRRSILAGRPFSCLFDLLARTRVCRREAANLIRAGALDFTMLPRPQLLVLLDSLFDIATGHRGKENLFAFSDYAVRRVELKDHSAIRKRHDEWAMLGMSARSHLVAEFRSLLNAAGFSMGAHVSNQLNTEVKLCGLLAASRTLEAERGGRMCFLTLSDESGLFEAVLFPMEYDEVKHSLAKTGSGMFWLSGTPEQQYDAITIRISQIGPLDRRKLNELVQQAKEMRHSA